MADDVPWRAVTIDYTNWKGERGLRRVLPLRFYFGRSEWHPAEQWLMDATDLDRGVERTFALANVHRWEGGQ